MRNKVKGGKTHFVYLFTLLILSISSFDTLYIFLCLCLQFHVEVVDVEVLEDEIKRFISKTKALLLNDHRTYCRNSETPGSECGV